MEFTATESPSNESFTDDPDAFALPLPIWISYMTVSIILITIAIYIWLALIRYSLVKNCCKASQKQALQRQPSSNSKVEQNNHSSSIGGGGAAAKGGSTSSTEGGRRKRSDGTGKAARPLRVLCLLAAFFALLRVSCDQLELATYGGERIDCKLIQVLVVVSYAISATLNYSALWVRLRIFFDHPVMKHLASKTVRFLIWFALFAIVGSSLLNTLIFTLTVEAVDKPNGCSLGETTSVSPLVRYVVLTISSVGAQVILLSLFLYPLMKHRSKVKSSLRRSFASSSTRSNNNNQNKTSTNGGAAFRPVNPKVSAVQHAEVRRIRNSNRTESDSDTAGSVRPATKRSKRKFISFKKERQANREKRLLKIIRRVLVTALVCVISDIVTAVATLAFNDAPRVASNLFFNANLLINIVSVLMSFGDWQERLLPCCVPCLNRSSKKSRHASASSVGSRLPLGRNEQRNLPDGARSPNGPPHWAHNMDSTDPATPSQLPDDEVFTFENESSTK